MSTEILFDPRRTAGIVKQHLIEELHRLQESILRFERFGPDVVIFPMLGRLGSTQTLEDMKARHDERVAQIRALQAALDKASDADLAAFVAGMKRDRKESK